MKQIYYIWEDSLSHDFNGMLKSEYEKTIWNARKKQTFYRRDGFETIEMVIDYVKQYFQDVEPQIIKR